MATTPTLTPAASLLRSFVVDLTTLAGCGLISYGAWLTYRPAGFIVAGLVLLAAGLNGGRR